MKITNVSTQRASTDNKHLWEFTQNLYPGDINCILGNKETQIISTFYSLIMAFSKEKNVGYLVSKKQFGKQNLYVRTNSISQSKPLQSLVDIENEISRLKHLCENPVIFIKDYLKICIGAKYWSGSLNVRFKETTKKLKDIAKKYKVTIYIFMLFESEENLKKYFLLFERSGNGLIRNKLEKYYFDKQFCMYRSKDYTYNARKKLRRRLLAAHPDLKSIKIIVSSIVGIGNHLWFSYPYPYIIVGTPYLFDKQLVPLDFMGYIIMHTCCGLPYTRYFPKDKSINIEEKYSSENLINFVENHLELIAWKLHKPNLKKEEALDAITGGFKKHIENCEQLSKKRKFP